MMTGNGNIPYICCFQLSCFAKENTKHSDHALHEHIYEMKAPDNHTI